MRLISPRWSASRTAGCTSIYLIFAFDLGSKAKWPVKKQLWVLLAGTIPTAAFFVERRISHELEGKLAEDAPAPVKA